MNYGMGSGRPAARSLRNLGLGCSLAESINGLIFPNAVNFGFTALECPGVHAAFKEGQTAEVFLTDWTVRNRETGKIQHALLVPEPSRALMLHGGVFPHLEKERLIALHQSAPRQKNQTNG